jgi:hypothetical protein
MELPFTVKSAGSPRAGSLSRITTITAASGSARPHISPSPSTTQRRLETAAGVLSSFSPAREFSGGRTGSDSSCSTSTGTTPQSRVRRISGGGGGGVGVGGVAHQRCGSPLRKGNSSDFPVRTKSDGSLPGNFFGDGDMCGGGGDDIDDMLNGSYSKKRKKRARFKCRPVHLGAMIACVLWMYLMFMLNSNQSSWYDAHPDAQGAGGRGVVHGSVKRAAAAEKNVWLDGGGSGGGGGGGGATATPRSRHIGLLPAIPAILQAAGWEDAVLRASDKAAYCAHSEPRFNGDCALDLTWRARRASMQRCLNATAIWLEAEGVDYSAIFSTLLAAARREPRLLISQPCEIAVTRRDYVRMQNLLHPGPSGAMGGEQRASAYAGAVVEDQPWDDRSVHFPEFHGEWWAPLGEVTGVAGMGLLYKPQEACSPMRFVDTATGLFCEAIVLDGDDAGGASEPEDLWLRWPGGPKKCPAFISKTRHHKTAVPCESDSCYRLDPQQFAPHKPCPELLGVTLRCPSDIEASLKGCYASQLKSGSFN